MAVVQGSKWDAAENLLKLLLKSEEVYCDSCGEVYDERFFPCCEDHIMGTHKTHLKELVRILKEQNKANFNEYGSTKGKTLRSCMSIPRKLLQEWSSIFEKQHGEKLFRTNDKKLHREDVRNAMRRFPYLRRCEKV